MFIMNRYGYLFSVATEGDEAVQIKKGLLRGCHVYKTQESMLSHAEVAFGINPDEVRHCLIHVHYKDGVLHETDVRGLRFPIDLSDTLGIEHYISGFVI